MANKLDHVAFNVPDVEKAARDFNEVFGIGSVLVFNEPLGLYIAVSDIGLVLSTEIDEKDNPSPVKDIWANNLITAIEVKVPDRDAVHEKMLARNIQPVFEMYSNAGFREYFYDKKSFYGYPTVVTEYPSESIIEAVDSDLAESPEDYGMELVWNWAHGYEGWSRKGKDYPDMAGNIPATSNSRIALCALKFAGSLDAAQEDFDRLFDMPMVRVRDEQLGLDIAMSDGGYILYDDIDSSNPSAVDKNFGADLLGGLGVRTNDLDGVTSRLAGEGVKQVYSMTGAGGLRAAYFEKTFHGLPILAVQYDGDSLLNATSPGLSGDPSKYSVDYEWKDGHSAWK